MKKIAQLFLAATFGAGSLTQARALNDPLPQASIRGLAEAPLCFEANHGQAASAADFIARGRDSAIFISPAEAVLNVANSGKARTMRLSLEGANARATISGLDEMAGRANYFIGTDAGQWHASVPLFARVRVEAVYPGIDVVYHADQSARLEYDFILQPGADPKQILLRVLGADKMHLNAAGDLILKIGAEEVRQPSPVIYQTVNGTRQKIAGGYRLVGKNVAAFWIGNYDHALPLVIDPTVLTFASYLAGQFGDHGWDVATDGNGNVYVCGDTLTPLLVSSKTKQFQTKYGGSQGTQQYGDAFVAKFVPNSSNVLSLAYLTYLGGFGQDSARAIAADTNGNAYVTGFTDSPNFPTAPANPAQKKISGRNNTGPGFYRSDAFVTKIGPEGTNLVYSTYLGGGERDSGNAIAVDSAGCAYVAGFTESINFPVVTNRAGGATRVVQSKMGGLRNAFITKVGTEGTNLIYSSYLGGSAQDSAQGIAVDADGNAYVTGYTVSENFPVRPLKNSYLNTLKTPSSAFDAFFTKISANADTNLFSTYLGGKDTDVGTRIAVKGASAYVTGYTSSTNFPVTGKIANTRVWLGTRDVFVTKFSPTNLVAFTNQIVLTQTNQIFFTNQSYFKEYSVKFGSSRPDQAFSIAVDDAGEACIVGYTGRTNFFGTNVFMDLRATNKSKLPTTEAFVALLSADASTFQFAALLGGGGSDSAHGVALDSAGNAYIVGGTSSTDFPTLHSVESRPGGRLGSNDVFVGVLALPITPAPAAKGRLVVQTAMPELQITQSDGSVKLSWPDPESIFVLESTFGLSPAVWQTVNATPQTAAGWRSVLLPTTNQSGYFRLRGP